MRLQITYEWTLEQIEDGDIVDIDFSDQLDFDVALVLDKPYYQLGLVMNEGNESKGVVNRLWAYEKGGKLPEYFCNAMQEPTGYKVPAKYHADLKKYLL